MEGCLVKPKRHVVHVWELDAAEAEEIGPLLRRTAAALADHFRPDQVYGPHLQVAMFDRGEEPPRAEVEAVAASLRSALAV